MSSVISFPVLPDGFILKPRALKTQVKYLLVVFHPHASMKSCTQHVLRAEADGCHAMGEEGTGFNAEPAPPLPFLQAGWPLLSSWRTSAFEGPNQHLPVALNSTRQERNIKATVVIPLAFVREKKQIPRGLFPFFQ